MAAAAAAYYYCNFHVLILVLRLHSRLSFYRDTIAEKKTIEIL